MRPDFKQPNIFALRQSLVLALWLGLSTVLGAQPDSDERTTEDRAAQFVFVLDDSLSMSHANDGEEAADPNRLAVFAVRSLITMLDDLDEVSLVRMNGPLAGEEPLPLDSLARQRRQIEKMLENNAVLPRYEGKQTPCSSALEAVGRLLEEAYRPGVAQVVLFLTDGRCNDGAVDPKGFLTHLRSHRDGIFQLYLLRFRGRQFSAALEELAEASGGQAIEVGSENPTALLEPFADALTRSQGYEADLLTPRRTRLAAHRGARRVRLLAVARGAGRDLEFEVRDRRGQVPPGAENPPQTGVYRYGQGATYRYATLEYRPGTTEVDVEITGAGGEWKVVAVPEYRLFVRLEMRRGECSLGGERRDHSIAAGETLCAVIQVVDEEGRVVSGELAGRGLEAGLRLTRQDSATPVVREYDANQQGRRAEFVFEQPHLEAGVWSLEPLVRLAGTHGDRSLPSRSHTLQAVTVNVGVEPREVEFGALVPGQNAGGEVVRIEGNFPPTQGRLEVVDRSTIPACVGFTLGDVGEGQPLPILQGQSYSLALRVAPYCGPESFDRRFTVQLRLLLDRAEGQDLPSQILTAHFGLTYKIEFPPEVAVRLRAGESQRVTVPILGNWSREQDFEVHFDGSAANGRWPTKGLLIGPVGETEGRVRLSPAGGEALEAQIEAAACCAAGNYEMRLELRPVAGGGEAVLPDGKPRLRTLQVPVLIAVDSAGLWACRGALILRGILVLILALLVVYVVSMFRNSSFFSRKHLAAGLVPLRWDPYGAPIRHPRSQQDVKSLVWSGLRPGARILAWLRANPLVFGLPGRRYRETVELLLQPERRADRSRLSLVSERDHLERLQTRPERGTGRLFARALGGRGHLFYAVPKGGVRIGRLVPENLAERELTAKGEEKAKVLRLKKRQRLIHPIPEQEREEGRAAGWQLG